jgi:hypothetical protein
LGIVVILSTISRETVSSPFAALGSTTRRNSGAALSRLVAQVASLQRWIAQQLAVEQRRPPLREHVATLAQIPGQDLEPDPPGAFTKTAFTINARAMTLTGPAGETERFRPGQVVEFDPEVCGRCAQRARCTMAAPGTGRTVTMAPTELLQVRLWHAMAAA